MPREQLAAGSRTSKPAGRTRRPSARSDSFGDGSRTPPFTDEIGDWDTGPDGRLTCWRTAADMAELLGVTTRRLLQLETLGMPARGSRGARRYPLPHATVWFAMYHVELELARQRVRGPVVHLDIEDAFEQHDAMTAVEDVKFEYEMRRDPELRARVEQIRREDAAFEREEARLNRRPIAKTTPRAQRTQRTLSSPES